MSRTNTKNSIERAFVAALQATLGSNAAFLNKCSFFTGQNTGELTLPAVVVSCSKATSILAPGSEVYKGSVSVQVITNAYDATAAADHDARALLVSQFMQLTDAVAAEINLGTDAHVYGYAVTDEDRTAAERDLADTISIEVDYQPI